ncbi:MAG: FliM/FliN family flagellar motor switch protein [Deltaproteobacteria bacterium]|nr:FliM/FliN family flagellar motor switch protein [Deltaproteobacteria bacterium]
MNDVFDEDLIRELGLDPEDVNGPGEVVKNKKPLPPKDPVPAAQESQEPPAPAAQADAPVKKPAAPAPEVKESKARPEPEPEDLSGYAKGLSQDLPVHLAAVVAKKSLKLKDILGVRSGEIMEFDKLPQDPIDLVANGKLIAKAELVVVDGKLGAKVIKLVK